MWKISRECRDCEGARVLNGGNEQVLSLDLLALVCVCVGG